MNDNRALEVFISYSHEDDVWRKKLGLCLSILERQGIISTWFDRKIRAGSKWENEIDDHINSAEIIILLVSTHFLASNYCYDNEFLRALERHENKEATVVPVIVRPCEWKETPISKLQALPKNGVAIAKWQDEDEAFLDVVTNLRALAKSHEQNNDVAHGCLRAHSVAEMITFRKDRTYLSIGVDVGTTKIAASLVKLSKNAGPEYNSDNIVRVEHDEIHNAEGVFEKIVTIIEEVIVKECIGKSEIDAIGLGLPGQVRRTDGWLSFAPGLQLRSYNFCAQLQRVFGVPVHADNDVNCATLAELVYGCQEIYENFVCIFVGTGIGAGIVVNNKIVRGQNFSAGEIGHMKIDFRADARECTCGQRGCFEEYASARAIVRLARVRMFDVIERKIDSSLRELNPRTIEPRNIASLIRQGDDEARKLANEIANYLSIGLANIATLLNPQAIILGGGIIDGFYDFPDFEKSINNKFKTYAIPECATTGLVRSSFKCNGSGSPAPIIGASLLPFEKSYAY
ncbi:ROK family protein [Accumulibacter sp.]|uniref:ROK family protein n=1 Tax=Accumulibacter sp. TaxID=2053492 RepID=UPI002C3AA55B|nr:ROK family protein [Accumulibacter sp.]HRF04366.1 ROK family protein [Accumulibacter sp.]